MFNHKSDQRREDIGLRPKQIAVQFEDNVKEGSVIILPSVEEFNRTQDLNESRASISDLSIAGLPENQELYDEEFHRLRTKYERFKLSHTYLNHLADLQNLSGRTEEVEYYLDIATRTTNELFIKLEYCSVLIGQNRIEQALSILSQDSIDQNVDVNLRLAHIMVRSRQLDRAKEFVDRALSIDITNYNAQMFDGALHLWKENWEQAVRSFRVAAEEKSDSSTLYTNLAAAYWGLGEKDKTIKSLRKAVNLDPLNENAVIFMADACFAMKIPEKCLAELEAILSYRKDSDALWGRAARAYYYLGKDEPKDKTILKKALDALAVQSRLVNSSDVINNMGVVYGALEDRSKAYRCFSQAFVKAQQLHEDDGISFSNFLLELIRLRKYREALNLSQEYIRTKSVNVYPKIFVSYIVSMEELGKRKEAGAEAIRILDTYSPEDETNLELIAYVLYNKTLVDPDPNTILYYIPRIVDILNRNKTLPDNLRCRAINNLVFALLKIGDYSQAKQYLGQLSNWIHSEPFSTATLGLYHLIMGHFDRAEDYYREAIKLSQGKETKSKVRQRMYIEFGRYFADKGNDSLSTRYLKRALKQKFGHKYAENEAQRLLFSKLSL